MPNTIRITTVLLAAFLPALLPARAQAQTSGTLVMAGSSATTAAWPQFRGPRGRSVLENQQVPDRWGTNLNVAWKTVIPGSGWSCPIVWGQRVFVTAVVSEGETEAPKKGLYLGGERPTPSKANHRWLVYCVDLTSGKILWSKDVHTGTPNQPHHLKNTYASETPVTDGQRVYAYFGGAGMFCLDYQGNEVWSKSWGDFKMRYGWGTAASPVLYQDRIYVVNDNEEHSFLTALEAKTGRQLWRVEREEKSNWATPLIWENNQRTELIVPGRVKNRSYDLDGHLLWELGGMSSIVIPTPLADNGLLYISSGFVGDKIRPLFAVRPGAAGDITPKEGETNSTYLAWSQKIGGPYNPSPLVYRDYFYVLYDFGFLSCYEARTGREVYGKQRLNAEGSTAFTASPWACDGKLFCLSEDGDTFVIQAGPEYKLVRKNSLNEMCMATPAMVPNGLLIRTASSLYCLRNTP